MESSRKPSTGLKGISVSAHRGASGTRPENTWAAFNRAAELGVRHIETDLSLMADGEILIHHDARLGRVMSGDALISEVTYAEICDLDAGSWFHQDYAGEKPLTLPMLLDWQKETGIELNLEMKTHGETRYEAMAKCLAEALKKHHDETCPLIVSSFSAEFLAESLKFLPAIGRALVATHMPDDWAQAAKRLNLEAFHLDCRYLTERQASAIREAKLRLGVYTVNDAASFGRMIDWQVDVVMTDYPERFM